MHVFWRKVWYNSPMKQWDQRKEFYIETENSAVDAFLEEISAVRRKHGLVISHEDPHGSFLVEDYDPEIVDWLMKAAISAQKE